MKQIIFSLADSDVTETAREFLFKLYQNTAVAAQLKDVPSHSPVFSYDFYLAKSCSSYILVCMSILVFLISFVLTEIGAWAAHKYLMHGFLWNLHLDHHVPTGDPVQKNDAFALIFAIPSFFSILIGSQFGLPLLAVSGYGIMAYGAVYFIVHESIIHRRFNFIRSKNRYFLALIRAHAQHHAVRTKEGADNFGMLLIHPKYFIKSFSI